MDEINSALIKRIEKYTMASVTPDRYAHSMRTAGTAIKLCTIYGEDAQKGYLAGIAHDMCKDMGGSFLQSLSQQSGYEPTEIEKKKNSLLHGRAASIILKNEFGIHDSGILEAVCHHTFGKKDMSNLARIIYIADKIEPGRPHMTGDYFDKLIKMPLDRLLFHIVQENIEYLREQGKEVAITTLEFYESLQEGAFNV